MRKGPTQRRNTQQVKTSAKPLANLRLSDSHSSLEEDLDPLHSCISPASLQYSKTFKGNKTPSNKGFLSPNNASKSRFTAQTEPFETDALEHYNLVSELGTGDFSTVKLAIHRITNQKFAIKIYNKRALDDPSLRKSVMREIKILKKIDHPNVVKYFEDMQGKNNLYIVMEYVKGVKLSDHLIGKALQRLEENEACEVFSQVMTALEYLHARSVTHRDIRLENVMLDLQFNAKLIDFGVATCFSNTKKTLVYCGGEIYMAPEIVNKQESHGPPIDIWAAGIVLYAMVTGVFPFNSKSGKRTLEKVKKGEYHLPDYLSPECKELIQIMLNPLPERRPNASTVLSHPWVRTNTRVHN